MRLRSVYSVVLSGVGQCGVWRGSVYSVAQVGVLSGAGRCTRWCRSVYLVQVSGVPGTGQYIQWLRPVGIWYRSVFVVGTCATKSTWTPDLRFRSPPSHRTSTKSPPTRAATPADLSQDPTDPYRHQVLYPNDGAGRCGCRHKSASLVKVSVFGGVSLQFFGIGQCGFGTG